MNWKLYIINKIRQSKKGIIDIIYSSLEKNANVSSRQDRIFVNVESKRYPYRCYDLYYYKQLKPIVEVNIKINNFIFKEHGGYDSLPLVFINNYFIGNAEQFQALEDLKLTQSVIDKDYMKRCLMCNIVRTDEELEECPACFKNYLFFTKKQTQTDIHSNRLSVV